MNSRQHYRLNADPWFAQASLKLSTVADPDVRRWCAWAVDALAAGRVHPRWRAAEFRERVDEVLRRGE